MMQPDELEKIKIQLLTSNNFRKDFFAQELELGQRKLIHDKIEEMYGNGARERSLISERADLAKYFVMMFNSNPTPTTTKEADMNPTNTPAIETRTYIYGTLAANINDDQIFGQVAGLEQQIEQLSKAQNKSKKLEAKIDSLHADIEALNSFVDARP